MDIQLVKAMVAKYQRRVDEHQKEIEKRGAQGAAVSAAADEVKSTMQRHGSIGVLILHIATDRTMLDFYKDALKKLKAVQRKQ